MINIASTQHPYYTSRIHQWVKFRDVFISGADFVVKYLEKFSSREDDIDFALRKNISYSPAHAKAAILDIKNAIYQRMTDITRINGPESYQRACRGELGGVDYHGNTMNSFIGQRVLPELITLERVGIYVDNDPVDPKMTKADSKKIRPYLYIYKAEDIRSWQQDRFGNFTTLLLRDTVDVVDEETNLVTDTKHEYRLYRLVPDGVSVQFFDADGVELLERANILTLRRIPFVLADIGQSLLEDVADYQIASLQLASSDMNYAQKSNFPFYTEQYNPSAEISQFLRSAVDDNPLSLDAESSPEGNSSQANKAKTNNLDIGVTHGRKYARGLERPAFINPSPDPLRVSMEKQEVLKQEMRQLIGLTLTNITSRNASAISKEKDQQGKEEGLSNIGLELEHCERRIAEIWAEYENYSEPITIAYPNNYSLVTDEQRLEKSKALREVLPTLPSKTFQIEMAKRIVDTLIANKVDYATIKQIHKELEEAVLIDVDPNTLRSDHEAGFVGTETASLLRGYPKGEVEQAKKDHAERAARIALAQSSAAARGVADLDSSADSAKKEKTISQSADNSAEAEKKVRGEASA